MFATNKAEMFVNPLDGREMSRCKLLDASRRTQYVSPSGDLHVFLPPILMSYVSIIHVSRMLIIIDIVIGVIRIDVNVRY